MSDYGRINGPALDRYITGNYGEDQYDGECMNEDCNDYGDCPFEYSIDECEANQVEEDHED